MPALRKIMDDYFDLQENNRAHVWGDPVEYREYIARLLELERRVDALYDERRPQRELDGSNSSTSHVTV